MGSESPISYPPEWRIVRLGDIATKIGSGATPTGGADSYQLARTRFALIRSQNVFDRRFDAEGLAFISDEQAYRLRSVSVEIDDLLLNITGDGVTFGRTCKAPMDILPACVNQHVSIIRVDPARAHPGFVLSYLCHPAVKAYIEAFNSGGSRRAITKAHIESFQLPLPPLREQAAIAHILDTLDEKIELNRRMNDTLEAMARALFNWAFVDRSEDEFSTWNHTRWGELVTLEYGKSLQGYDESKGPFPVYGTNGLIGSHSAPLSNRDGVIIGRKGAYRGVHYSPDPFWAIDTAFFLRPKTQIEMRWAYYELLRSDINSMDSGSAIPSTSREDFYAIPVVAPPIEAQRGFVRTLEPAWRRQRHNEEESRTLATLRDILLPKLISGELRVKDAEKIAARAM